jgi:MFS family permease
MPLALETTPFHHAKLCRGKFMVGLAAFWMVGSLFTAGVGWAMIPTVGWRAFLVVAALPAFAAAAGCLLLLPESPRHLLVHGKVGPAEKVGAVLVQLRVGHFAEPVCGQVCMFS